MGFGNAEMIPQRGPKTSTERIAELAELNKAGAEMVNIDTPKIEEIRTNFDRLRAARKEFETIASEIENLDDRALKDAQILITIARINAILENEDIQLQDIDSKNRDNLSRAGYETELQRLGFIKKKIESL